MSKNWMDPKYLKEDQIWLVTTEGDCEGRSTHTIGYYQGTIDAIALALADQSLYTLRFTPVEPQKPGVPTREGVSVVFGGDLYTSDAETMAAELRAALGSRVNVGRGTYSWAVELVSKKPLDKRAILRQKALAKLSPEEVAALGLD